MKQLSIIDDRVNKSDIPSKPWRFWREEVIKHPFCNFNIIPTNDVDWTYRCKVYAFAQREGFDDCPFPMPENHLCFAYHKEKCKK